MAIIKTSTINVVEGEKKREPSHILGGNVNWYNYGQQYECSWKVTDHIVRVQKYKTDHIVNFLLYDIFFTIWYLLYDI